MDKDKLLTMIKALVESLESPYHFYDDDLFTDCYDTVFTLFENEMECDKCPLKTKCVNEKEKSCATLIVEYLQERKYKDEQ